MKKVLALAAIGEAATGLLLLIIPSLVVRLLFGVELTNVSFSIARVTGMALLGLGIACWPRCTPLCGMLTYSALATLYLGYIAVRGELVGILLWPAVVLHAILCLLLAFACLKQQRET
jgi:hypothetical protein